MKLKYKGKNYYTEYSRTEILTIKKRPDTQIALFVNENLSGVNIIVSASEIEVSNEETPVKIHTTKFFNIFL